MSVDVRMVSRLTGNTRDVGEGGVGNIPDRAIRNQESTTERESCHGERPRPMLSLNGFLPLRMMAKTTPIISLNNTFYCIISI